MRYSQSEWQSRIEDSDFHSEIQMALRSDGFVIFDSVLEEFVVKRLHKAMLQRIDDHVDAVLDNQPQDRYHLPLHLEDPFLDAEVVTNPLVMPTLVDVLGDDLAVSYFGSDSVVAAPGYQPVHTDGRPLFHEFPVVLPPYGVVVNFLLVDYHENNGPTDFWPNASHQLASIDPQVGSRIIPPTSLIAPAGSLVMRDLRMWHRGTPSNSDVIRSMIAVVYSRSWYRFGPAEVGYPEPRISEREYQNLRPEVQSLFRFATRDAAALDPTTRERISVQHV